MHERETERCTTWSNFCSTPQFALRSLPDYGKEGPHPGPCTVLGLQPAESSRRADAPAPPFSYSYYRSPRSLNDDDEFVVAHPILLFYIVSFSELINTRCSTISLLSVVHESHLLNPLLSPFQNVQLHRQLSFLAIQWETRYMFWIMLCGF